MMIGTALNTKGGISSLIRDYLHAGIIDKLGIDYFPTHKEGSRLEKIVFYLKNLIRIMIKMKKYKILHIHTASWWSYRRLFIIILLGKIFTRKIIIHLHGAMFHIYYQKANIFEKKIIEFGFNLADKIIVLSDWWREQISKITDLNRIIVVKNAVYIKDCKKNIFKNFSRPLNVLFMGRLEGRKGVYDVLDAAEKLSPKEVVISLCGDGEISNVKKKVEEKGIGKWVKIMGWIDGKRKELMFKKAHIFLLPSYNEGLPMSILEALAYGIPVISTPVGGIPEAIRDGQNGFLIPPGCHDLIVDTLRKIANNPELWKQLSLNARKTYKEKFDMKYIEYKLRQVYSELLKNL